MNKITASAEVSWGKNPPIRFNKFDSGDIILSFDRPSLYVSVHLSQTEARELAKALLDATY